MKFASCALFLAALSSTTQAATIDGVMDVGEWTDATVLQVTGGQGTVSVFVDADYIYAAFDVPGDTVDGRVNYNHGQKLGININPTPGSGNWGFPMDLIFQVSMNALPWGGTSAGPIDGFGATQWGVEGVDQLSLPLELQTVTLYGTGHRVTELRIPLATIAPTVGDTLWVGGAVDYFGLSYSYPIGINFSSSTGYAPIAIVPDPATAPLGPGDVLGDRLPFSLWVASPATRDGIRVRLALPTADPARLEIFDVGGRLIGTRDLTELGAGSHTIDLADGLGLSRGLVLLRLSQGNNATATRLVVTR
jgi:hypothetical protein